MSNIRLLLGLLITTLLFSCAGLLPPESPVIIPTVSTVYTPSQLLAPTSTIFTTLTPEIPIANADLALFNGDYSLAQSVYQSLYASTTDLSLKSAALWGLGLSNMQAGNDGAALESFGQLIANYLESPHRVQAQFLRAEIMMKLERYLEATDEYSTYLLLKPGLIDYYVYDRRGDAYAALGNFTAAVSDYRSALSSAHISDDISLQIKLARTLEFAGETIDALSMYDTIAAASSNDSVKAQMDLFAGQLHLALSQPEEAYAHFLHSVENFPLSYDSYSALVALVNAGIPVDDLDRGLVDYYAGQYGYALEAFSRYIAAYPDNDGTVVYYRALALRDSALYQEAVDGFTSFIDRYPTNCFWQAAWEEKAYTQWADLDQYDISASTLLEFTQRTSDPTTIPQALLTTGHIYENANMLELAASTWESVPDANPGSDLVPQALFGAGIARFRAGQYQMALVDFQRGTLFSLTPSDQARTLFWSGKTQQVLGDTTAAQSSFQQAASIDQTNYYSLRAKDLLFNRAPFPNPPAYDLGADLEIERLKANAWLRVTFGLQPETDLSTPGLLALDGRFKRGSELWELGLRDEASQEFENLRTEINASAEDTYRLSNYLLDLGLNRSAITGIRQVLNLAGMDEQSQTLAAPPYFNLVRYGTYYQDLILPSAEINDLHPFLLFSLVRQESLFDGSIQSAAGARGLMQIMPETGQYLAENFGWPPDYSDIDLYRPIVSIKLGSYYLMNNRSYFGGDLYSALAAYNGGPGNAEAWRDLSGNDPDLFLETIQFSETRDYIRRIYENFWMYRFVYEAIP